MRSWAGGKLAMLLVTMATVLAIVGAWYLTPEELWLDAVDGYEVTLLTSGHHASDGRETNTQAVEGDGSAKDSHESAVPKTASQERRALALMGRDMHFVIVGGIIVLIEIFVFLIHRVNRNIHTMERRFR